MTYIPEYKQGHNPSSHHNNNRPRTKKVIIPVTCDHIQKNAVDHALKDINFRGKSKYITQLLLKGVENNITDLYPSGKGDIDWQISLLPEERDRIYKWCSKNLPHKSRSRWILNLIINH